MRLFIGIDLPQNIKQEIHDFLLPIQQSPKGWEHPHDYHQTLLFIGEASEAEKDLIVARMGEISFSPFELSTDKFTFFNRRIMYLSFKFSPELLHVKEVIDRKFPEWYRPEAREFIPHVTVKRWQRYEYDHLQENLLERPFKGLRFEVNKLSLFLSRKDEFNRKYHVIYSQNA